MSSVLNWYYNFDWADAPLSSIVWPSVASAVYLTVVAVMLQWNTKRSEMTKTTNNNSDGLKTSKKPLTIGNKVLAYHNLILCVWSLVMFIGTVLEAIRRTQGHPEAQPTVVPNSVRMSSTSHFEPNLDVIGETQSTQWFLCETPNTKATGSLYFWSYIYYLSKYYELFDTVIALAKGSVPPSLSLHVYHHSVVVFMAWLWLEQAQSLQFGGLLFNTFVHVVMYYYYYKRALGQFVWWKNIITKLQIVQFMTSFLLLFGTIYVAVQNSPSTDRIFSTCSGLSGLAFNGVFNTTLLFSFLGVLRRNVASSKKSKTQ